MVEFQDEERGCWGPTEHFREGRVTAEPPLVERTAGCGHVTSPELLALLSGWLYGRPQWNYVFRGVGKNFSSSVKLAALLLIYGVFFFFFQYQIKDTSVSY